ncbi:MAG TPA: MFS transporter, partial [Actinomycetota bacterium]|nr:MFS transporter [Actinomycetota bacterium]
VIRSYLVLSGLFTLSASLIWGINTLFLLHAGLSIFEVFVANAAFTAAMAVLEIPTGVVADTRGRRASFLLSEITLAVGTLAYVGVAAIHGGLLLFCLAGVILGLGYTFYSGAVEAWLVDALQATGYTKELDGVFARASTVSSFAMIAGTILGGLLGQIGLSVPYLARTALILLALVVGFLTMFDIGFTPRVVGMKGIGAEMKKVAKAGVTYGWNKPSVRLLVLQSFVSYGFFSWAWYAWQPYFLELYGSNAIWLSGLIASVFALAGIVGNQLVRRIAVPGRRRTTILLWTAGISSATMVATGTFRTFWIAVPVFLLGAVAGGLSGPVRQTYFHHSIPSSERATLVSFDSLVGSVGSVGGQTGLGWLSQERSIPAGFVVGGLFTLLVLPIYGRLRSLHEPADRIEPDAPDAEAAEVSLPPAPAGSDGQVAADELPAPS